MKIAGDRVFCTTSTTPRPSSLSKILYRFPFPLTFLLLLFHEKLSNKGDLKSRRTRKCPLKGQITFSRLGIISKGNLKSRQMSMQLMRSVISKISRLCPICWGWISTCVAHWRRHRPKLVFEWMTRGQVYVAPSKEHKGKSQNPCFMFGLVRSLYGLQNDRSLHPSLPLLQLPPSLAFAWPRTRRCATTASASRAVLDHKHPLLQPTASPSPRSMVSSPTTRPATALPPEASAPLF